MTTVIKNTNLTIDHIYEVENTPEILSFVIPNTDVLIWPLIRYNIFRDCHRKISTRYEHDPWPNRAAHFSKKNFFQTLRSWPNRDIWLHSNMFSRYYKLHKNRPYEYIFEPLAEVLPNDTLLLDPCMHEPFLEPTAGFNLLRTNVLNQAGDYLLGNIPCANYEAFAKQFVSYLKGRLEQFKFDFTEQFYQDVHTFVMSRCKHTLIRTNIYEKVIQKKCPKVFIGVGVLAGNFLDIVPLLKKYGVTIVEAQHSAIGRHAFGTDFAPNIVGEKALKDALPDFYLTYGKYWHNKLNVPSKPYLMGNPWLTICLEENPYNGGDAIIFALNGDYDRYTQHVGAVKRKYPKREIILRPHPAHRELISTWQIFNKEGITVDMSSNFYETLARCDTVISEYSGTTYDAISTGKKVLILKNDMTQEFDEIGFSFFNDEDELVELIENTSMPSEEIANFYNEKNWQENYSLFIENIIKK